MATRTFKIMCSAHIIFLLDCAAIGSWKPLRDFVQEMNVIRLGFYFLIFFKFFKLSKYGDTFTGDLENTEQNYI